MSLTLRTRKYFTFNSRRNILSTLSVRLVDGATEYEGIVEVFDRCVWGGVTSWEWSIKEANVVCRQLGYPSASDFSWDHYDFGLDSRTVVFGDVTCQGDEASLEECNYTRLIDAIDGYYYFDGMVRVSCHSTAMPPGKGIARVRFE